MARLSLSGSLVFRHAKAVAATVNGLYNSIRDWTVSSLSVDSLRPRAIERRHYKEPITIVGSKTNRHTGAIAVGSPVCEVTYTQQHAQFQALALGFVWPRRGDGDVTTPDTVAANEGVFIDWYDNGAGAWHGGYRPVPYLPPYWGFGSLDTLFLVKTGPNVGPIPTYPPPLVQTGGGPCTVTSLIVNLEEHDSLIKDMTKIGLFGTAGHAAFDGKAELWVFVEDKGIT